MEKHHFLWVNQVVSTGFAGFFEVKLPWATTWIPPGCHRHETRHLHVGLRRCFRSLAGRDLGHRKVISSDLLQKRLIRLAINMIGANHFSQIFFDAAWWNFDIHRIPSLFDRTLQGTVGVRYKMLRGAIELPTKKNNFPVVVKYFHQLPCLNIVPFYWLSSTSLFFWIDYVTTIQELNGSIVWATFPTTSPNATLKGPWHSPPKNEQIQYSTRVSAYFFSVFQTRQGSAIFMALLV